MAILQLLAESVLNRSSANRTAGSCCSSCSTSTTRARAFLESKRTTDITETVGQAVERLRILSAAADRMAKDLPDALRGARAGAPVPAD